MPPTGATETLENMIGLEEAKQILHEALIMPIKYPQLFQGKMNKITKICIVLIIELLLLFSMKFIHSKLYSYN